MPFGIGNRRTILAHARAKALLLALSASGLLASGAVAVAQESASLQVSAARPGLLWLSVEGRSYDNVSDPSKSNGVVTATVISDGSLDLSVRTNYPWWLTIATAGGVSHLFGPNTQLHWSRIRSSLLPVVPAGEEVHISLEWVGEESPGDKAQAIRPAPRGTTATTAGASASGGSGVSTSGASGSSTWASGVSTDASAPKRPTETRAAESGREAGESGQESGAGLAGHPGASNDQAQGTRIAGSNGNSKGNSNGHSNGNSNSNSNGKR